MSRPILPSDLAPVATCHPATVKGCAAPRRVRRRRAKAVRGRQEDFGFERIRATRAEVARAWWADAPAKKKPSSKKRRKLPVPKPVQVALL